MMRSLGRPLLAMLFLGLSGCGGLTAYYPEGRTAETDLPTDTDTDTDTDSDTDTDTDTDSDTDTDTDVDILPLEVDEVDPAHGSDAGGSVVEILGGPFDGSAQVWFGDKKATVVDTTNDTVRVRTPSGEAGYAHVRVTTDTHAGELENAFLYWPDGTGQIGLFGSFQRFEWAGSYWSDDPSPTAGAGVYFIEPTSAEWWQLYAPGFNQCRSNYTFAGEISVFDPDLSRITLRRGADTAFNLFKASDPTYLYETSGDVIDYYVGNAVYDMESAGSAEWPAFTVAGAVSTPASFRVLSPSISGSSLSTVSRSNLTFSWSGGAADYVVLRMLRVRPADNVTLEEVTCVVDDTGSYTVPSSVWSSWSQDMYLYMYVGRVKESNGVLPYNNADSGLVGVQWIIGAGITN